MPIWLQIALGSSVYGLPLLALITRVYVRTSNTNQHFDPSSPVSQAMGATMPQQVKDLRDGQAEMRLAVDDLQGWRPKVNNHQVRQDGRIHAIDGGGVEHGVV